TVSLKPRIHCMSSEEWLERIMRLPLVTRFPVHMNWMSMVSFMLGCIAVLIVLCSSAGESTASTDTGPESWTDKLEEYKKTWPDKFGIGRSADKDFIARWDIDVRPDGKGLPKGTGRAKNGALIYSNKCASCHGINGVEGPEDNLVTSSNG